MGVGFLGLRTIFRVLENLATSATGMLRKTVQFSKICETASCDTWFFCLPHGLEPSGRWTWICPWTKAIGSSLKSPCHLFLNCGQWYARDIRPKTGFSDPGSAWAPQNTHEESSSTLDIVACALAWHRKMVPETMTPWFTAQQNIYPLQLHPRSLSLKSDHFKNHHFPTLWKKKKKTLHRFLRLQTW